jgi:hypothetical protein
VGCWLFGGIISGGSGGLMRLMCTLYRGSFAVVKEGRHKASGTVVAIKIVDKKDAVFDPESLEQEVSSAYFPQIGHFWWHVFASPARSWGSHVELSVG